MQARVGHREAAKWHGLVPTSNAAPFHRRKKQMSVLKTNPIVFFWRWFRYTLTKWQMKNVDPMYPDMIKYVKDKNEFESTYGTGW